MTDILKGEAPSLTLSPFTLTADSLAIPSDMVDKLLATEAEFPTTDSISIKGKEWASNVPSAFVVGLSYTASRGAGPELSPSQLENIPVGIQDAAVAPGSLTIIASSLETPAQARIEQSPEEIEEMFESPIKAEALEAAKKIQKQSAKHIAQEAQAKRVSRRLLLIERSKKLTVTCPTTGIVSLIEIPAIPFPQNNPRLAKAMVWTSPFADLSNCRGIAQQGVDYLKRLDTQILAGVLLVLADSYELFQFQPFDSGAQKNAILRTAGKHYLIDAIIMIETLIHSANCSYLPKLSLRMDMNLAEYGLEVRMQAYLKQLADAIAKPDKEVWDEKKIKPQYPIRPVYIKDVESGLKKISFLARQEQQRAKKEFAEDKKAGKLAVSLLSKQVSLTPKMKLLLDGILSDEGMLVMPSIIMDAVCEKLGTFTGNDNAAQLIKIIRKDRKALILNLSELEASMVEEGEDDEFAESTDSDDAAPGQEAAIEDNENSEQDSEEERDAESDDETEQAVEQAPAPSSSTDNSSSIQNAEPVNTELVAPAGLNAWEQLMWKKKMLKASEEAKPRVFIQSDIPSVATYIPSDAKDKLGRS